MDFMGFGALNFDRLYKVESLATGDEEVEITDSEEQPGGSAANTMYALGRLGKSTGFTGAVGSDAEGEKVLESLSGAGVDTSRIAVKKEVRTGRVVGLVDGAGERALYISPGANNLLSSEDLDMDFIASAGIVHMTSFVSDRQLELQKQAAESLAASGRTKLSFAPGSLYVKKGLDAISAILYKSHIVFLNEEEARILTGREHVDAAEQLLSSGCVNVAVTLGERGCYLANDKQKVHVESGSTEVVDTTGAGDAFCAGFLFGLSEDKTLRECGIIGSYVASCCIASMGARSGLPDRVELEKAMAEIM